MSVWGAAIVSNEHSLYYFIACNVVHVISVVDRVDLRQVFACQYYSSHAAYSGFILNPDAVKSLELTGLLSKTPPILFASLTFQTLHCILLYRGADKSLAQPD